jgi:hypothetical protein
MIRRTMAGALVIAPLLFTGTELVRLSVEHGTDSPAAGLSAILDSRASWELFGWLVLVTAPVWLVATLGMIEALRGVRERWATIAGAVGIVGALGWAMHQASYVELNAVAAYQLADHADVAIEMYAGAGGTGMEDATLIAMAAGLMLGCVSLLLGHARAGLIPWWAFACVPAWLVVTAMAGGASPVFALGNLVLVPPFALVARQLTRPGANAAEPVFVA